MVEDRRIDRAPGSRRAPRRYAAAARGSLHSLAPAGKITTGSPQRARRAAATIEAALMAQHGLSVVELRASLWDTLRMAFAPAVSVVPTSRRVGRLLRGEAPAVED